MRTPLGSHEAAGEPTPLIVDSRFIGWAMGGSNAIRSRQFTKDAMQPRTLWPDWDDISADGWPIPRAPLVLVDVPTAWLRGLGGEPSLRDLTRGNLTGCGDDGALD